MSARKKKNKRTGALQDTAHSSVPDQYLGFTLQETLLAQRLLSAPKGSVLSLEVLDDVGIETASGETVAIQAKSALVSNPIANRAVALWNTFHNWLRLIDSGLVDIDSTTFVLYVSRPLNGQIAQAFHAAKTIEEAAQAVSKARGVLEAAAKRQSNGEMPRHIDSLLSFVLGHEHLPRLLTKFELAFGSGKPLADLESALAQQFLAEGQVEAVSQQVQGFLRREIAGCLENRIPAIVARDRLFAEIGAFLRKISVQHILQSYAQEASASEAAAERRRTYVRQIELIELDDDHLLSAISDYLSATANRTEWARRGLVHESSFSEFTVELRQVWRNRKIASDAQRNQDEVSRGQFLFSNCMLHQARLQGSEIPLAFVRGCFHALSEESSIGWHPNFRKLLA